MVDDDWFRNPRWGPDDQKAFFERLSRSRGNFNKSQYARTKASALLGTKKKNLVFAAKDLLNKIIQEWPDKSDLAPCFLELANCEVFLGKIDFAIGFYRKCLQQEKINPNMRTEAWVEFPLLIIRNNLSNYYDEALKVLSEFKSSFPFPYDMFVVHGVQSLIAYENGNLKYAEENAKKALEIADVKTTGLSYHPKVGLVVGQEDIIARLRQIV